MSGAAKNGTTVLCWPGRLLSEEDLRRHWASQVELVLGPRTIVTPLAWDWLKARKVHVRRDEPSSQKAAAPSSDAAWGYASASTAKEVAAAARALALDGRKLRRIELASGPLPGQVRGLAKTVVAGDPQGICLFCEEPGIVACLANKTSGVRAANPASFAHLASLQKLLGPNFYAIGVPGRTYFELRQLLRRATDVAPACPESLRPALTELDGHAHR
jgi:hypothetical protein